MFCEKCGTKNPEVARFCENCGASLSVVPVSPAGGAAAAVKKKTKAGVIIIALVLIAALAVGAYFLFFKDKSNNSPEAVFDNLFEGMNKCDVNILLKAFPSAMVSEIEQQMGGKEFLENTVKNVMNSIESTYGKGSFKYRVLAKTPLDKDHLISTQESFNNMYGANASFSEGYSMEVEKWYACSEGNVGVDSAIINVYKINGSWYIIDFDTI